MHKDSKHKCYSASHKQLKNNAKIRLDELQVMFASLQYARKEGQHNISALEDQIKQKLSNWKTELDDTSSASSIHGPGSSFTMDINRLLILGDEEDDATSPLDESKMHKHNNDGQSLHADDGTFLFPNTNQCSNYNPQATGFEESNYTWSNIQDPLSSNLETNLQAQYDQYGLQPNVDGKLIIPYNGLDQDLGNMLSDLGDFDLQPTIQPPPSAFLGPTCALWDCPRPPSTYDPDYCDTYHAFLALQEAAAGNGPVLRPGGISVKDNMLFDALRGKIQGKEVGIPECAGAISARSPWNAPVLFDLSLCEGETIREWLFFDKPRKAFEIGNRKQRSLPDYNGRGWHESRKQVHKEFEGLKRSYYMDPQPEPHLEWHLFEYGIEKCDASALYRLELKLVDEKKKSKGKVAKDPVAELQTRMRKLTANMPTESKVSTMSMNNASKAFDGCSPCAPNQMAPTAGSLEIRNGDDNVDIFTDSKRI